MSDTPDARSAAETNDDSTVDLRPLLALSTAGSEEEAERLASALVEESLAACVNVVPGLRSIYRWQGETCRDAEWLLIIKTVADRLEELERRLRELHSYDVPELIVTAIDGGSRPYLEWLASSCRTK